MANDGIDRGERPSPGDHSPAANACFGPWLIVKRQSRWKSVNPDSTVKTGILGNNEADTDPNSLGYEPRLSSSIKGMNK